MAFRDKVKRRYRKMRRRVGRVVKRGPKLKFVYGWHLTHSPIVDNRIIFESFHGKNISDSPLAVLKELMKSDEVEKYEIFYATDNIERDASFVKDNNLPVELVHIGSYKYTEVIATAHYLINNSSFPAYFMKREGQIYIQTWHGTPLKTLGKNMRLGMQSMTNVQHNFLEASYITFPNEFTKQVIMHDYNLEDLYTGDAAMVGYPRNTVFMQGPDEEIIERYDLGNYQNYAYMPTWRGVNNLSVNVKKFRRNLLDHLLLLDQTLRDDQRVFVNLHSMLENRISLDEYEHIFPFPKDVSTYDFLAQMDTLITDYSSVAFDYALTGKPIILFAYDVYSYMEERGFYFPIEELPFPIFYTIDDLGEYLQQETLDASYRTDEDFAKRFLGYDSIDNSKKVLDLLLHNNASEVPLISYASNKEKPWNIVFPEQRVSQADIRSVFECVDPKKDILAISRARFGRQSSSFVYDNYRDHVNYVFFTKTTPRSFMEEARARLHEDKRDIIEKRELKRMLPNLRIESTSSTFLHIEQKGSFSESMADFVDCSIIEGADDIAVLLPSLAGRLQSVFVESGRTVKFVRVLEEAEKAEGFALVNFKHLLEDPTVNLGHKKRYNIYVTYLNDAGEVRVGIPYMPPTPDMLVQDRYCKPIFYNVEDLDMSLWELDPRYPNVMPMRAVKRGIAIRPYFRKLGRLAFLVTSSNQASVDYFSPSLKKISCPKNGPIKITIQTPLRKCELAEALLISRADKENCRFSLPFKTDVKGKFLQICLEFDPTNYNFHGVYWDLRLLFDEGYEHCTQVSVRTTYGFITRTRFLSIHHNMPEENIIFPYSARGRKLAFAYRAKSPYDNQMTKFKEVLAYAIYVALRPYWRRKHVWLIFEKFSAHAQDNAYYFFKYCMEETDGEGQKFAYFVIDKNCKDYVKVAQYDDNVIQFMSLKHMIYCLASNIYIGSDSKPHLYQWRPKPSIIRSRLVPRKILFLQHGVTALKKVHPLFGKRGSSPMTYFLTTSEKEQDIVVQNLKYRRGAAPILGFSRWDSFNDRSDPDNPIILLMPTWRPWLEEQTDEVFLESDYYKAYLQLIQDPTVLNLLEKTNARIKFYIHPKLSEFLKNFTDISRYIDLVDSEKESLNEIIQECSFLITDYSSVCWDVAFMGKPVMFYQFDQERYEEEIGSYIDLNEELPGKVCFNIDDCVEALAFYCNNGFMQTPEDVEKVEAFLPSQDKLNRERTYQFLRDKGF